MMNTNGMQVLVATLCFILMATPFTETMTTPMANTAEMETTEIVGETTMIIEQDTTAAMETAIVTVLDTTAAPQTAKATVKSTAAQTATPAVPTTAIIPNYAVADLQETIGRNGCGTTSLCASLPEDCDPSGPNGCNHFSAQRESSRAFGSTNYLCQLSGFSSGYIGATVSTDPTLGGNDHTYVCANDGNGVRFIGAFFDNDNLTPATLNVNNVAGSVTNDKIQCQFRVTIPNTASGESSYTIALINGTFDSASGQLGQPNVVLKTAQVNLTDPIANVTNILFSHAVIDHQSLTPALLVTVGVVSLLML